MVKQKAHKYFEMTWMEFQDKVKETPFAVLPVGALEQHGPHMPIGSDVLIAEYMAERIAKATGFILLPALQYTPSFSLRNFPGTMQMSDESCSQQLLEIAESLARHGIKATYLIIGHIGAIKACQTAERRLILENESIRFVNIAMPGMQEAIQKYCTSQRWHSTYAHAEEFETCALLAIRPELVDMSKAVKEYPPKSILFGPISIAWDEFCQSGVIGDPTVASAEKGKAILDFMIGKALEIIDAHQKSI